MVVSLPNWPSCMVIWQQRNMLWFYIWCIYSFSFNLNPGALWQIHVFCILNLLSLWRNWGIWRLMITYCCLNVNLVLGIFRSREGNNISGYCIYNHSQSFLQLHNNYNDADGVWISDKHTGLAVVWGCYANGPVVQFYLIKYYLFQKFKLIGHSEFNHLTVILTNSISGAQDSTNSKQPSLIESGCMSSL